MEVTFPPPLANAADFPEAQIRVSPGIRTALARSSVGKSARGPFFERLLFTKSGRAALGHASKALGLRPDDRVIVPAYHCPAIIEPFLWSRARIDFYGVTKDLEVDLEDFEKKLAGATACVLVRYFGFPQNLREAAQLAHNNNVTVIEDCAHSFFTLDSAQGLDPVSSVAIFSLSKFFPTLDGGAMCVPEARPFPPMRAQPGLVEARALFRSLGLSNPLSWVRRLFKKTTAPNQSAAAARFRYFDPSELDIECFRLTEWIVRHGDMARIAEERRTNFGFLLKNLSSSRVGRPFFRNLPDGVVPYVFPFLLEHESSFGKIREKGLEVLRWEEFATSDCLVSDSYRTKLVQLPCRQGLTQTDLQDIVSIVESSEGSS